MLVEQQSNPEVVERQIQGPAFWANPWLAKAAERAPPCSLQGLVAPALSDETVAAAGKPQTAPSPRHNCMLGERPAGMVQWFLVLTFTALSLWT